MTKNANEHPAPGQHDAHVLALRLHEALVLRPNQIMAELLQASRSRAQAEAEGLEQDDDAVQVALAAIFSQGLHLIQTVDAVLALPLSLDEVEQQGRQWLHDSLSLEDKMEGLFRIAIAQFWRGVRASVIDDRRTHPSFSTYMVEWAWGCAGNEVARSAGELPDGLGNQIPAAPIVLHALRTLYPQKDGD